MTVVEILTKARELLLTKGWTQGTFARNADGFPIDISAIDAGKGTCFCEMGAVIAADPSQNLYSEARAYVRKGNARVLKKAVDYPACFPVRWNDSPKRTKEQVIKAFDYAIQYAERDNA